MKFKVFITLCLMIVWAHTHQESQNPSQSQVVVHGTIELKDYYFRILKGAKNGSAYITMTQQGENDDKLIAVKSDISNSVELHDHITDEKGVKHMTNIAFIDIPGTHHGCNFITCLWKAKQTPVVLTKGGKHIMFMGLKSPDSYQKSELAVTLVFEKAGEVKVMLAPEQNLEEPCDCPHHRAHGHAHNHNNATSKHHHH